MANYFNEIPNNKNEVNKIDKIKLSIKSFKDVEQLEKNALDNITDQASLKTKLKDFSQKIENTFWIWWLWPQWLADSTIDTIVDNIWWEIKDLINTANFSLSDWIKNKWWSLTWLISGNKISHSELEIRYFVDTVYSVWYSFQKNNQWEFEIIDENWNIVNQLDQDLISINWWNVQWATVSNQKEILDDILLERSFTWRWEKNIQEMVEILETVWINAENEAELDSITPEKLTEAYLTYYAKKAELPIPNKNNSIDIEAFFNTPKVIALNIPIEKITYIRLYSKGSFDNSLKKWDKNNDVTVLQNVMKDFYKLTKWTKNNLGDLLKQTSSKAWKMFENWIWWLMEYMSWPEWLLLAWAMIYFLFFSNHKKKAWASIALFAGVNVLTKAFNQDNNSWLLQVLAKQWEKFWEIDLKNRPKVLEWLENSWFIWVENQNQKLNTVWVLSRKNLWRIIESSKIDNNWNIKVDFVKMFDAIEINALEKIWWGDVYKSKVELLLTEFFNSAEMNNYTWQNWAEENIKFLENKYNWSPISFSLLIAKVFLFNVNIRQNTNNPQNTNSSQNNWSWTAQQAPINNPLNIFPTPTEKQIYISKINLYKWIKPTKQALMILINTAKKDAIITQLSSSTWLSQADKIIIKDLIIELNK